MREGKILFNIIVLKPRMFGVGVGLKETGPSPIQLSSSDYFSKKTVRSGMFKLGLTRKEILSCLFNLVNLKFVPGDVVRFTTDMRVKIFSQGSGYIELCEKNKLFHFYSFF